MDTFLELIFKYEKLSSFSIALVFFFIGIVYGNNRIGSILFVVAFFTFYFLFRISDDKKDKVRTKQPTISSFSPKRKVRIEEVMDTLVKHNVLKISISDMSKIWQEDENKVAIGMDNLVYIWKLPFVQKVQESSGFEGFEHKNIIRLYQKIERLLFPTENAKQDMALQQEYFMILKILKWLDSTDAPSVVDVTQTHIYRQYEEASRQNTLLENDFQRFSLGQKENVNEYDILRNVSLRDHSIDVAHKIIKYVVSSDKKASLSIAIIAALAHDLGKMPGVIADYKTTIHPKASVTILEATDEYKRISPKKRFIINTAILYHHANIIPKTFPGEYSDDESLSKMATEMIKLLKKADSLSREEEIREFTEGSKKKKQKEPKKSESETAPIMMQAASQEKASEKKQEEKQEKKKIPNLLDAEEFNIGADNNETHSVNMDLPLGIVNNSSNDGNSIIHQDIDDEETEEEIVVESKTSQSQQEQVNNSSIDIYRKNRLEFAYPIEVKPKTHKEVVDVMSKQTEEAEKELSDAEIDVSWFGENEVNMLSKIISERVNYIYKNKENNYIFNAFTFDGRIYVTTAFFTEAVFYIAKIKGIKEIEQYTENRAVKRALLSKIASDVIGIKEQGSHGYLVGFKKGYFGGKFILVIANAKGEKHNKVAFYTPFIPEFFSPLTYESLDSRKDNIAYDPEKYLRRRIRAVNLPPKI